MSRFFVCGSIVPRCPCELSFLPVWLPFGRLGPCWILPPIVPGGIVASSVLVLDPMATGLLRPSPNRKSTVYSELLALEAQGAYIPSQQGRERKRIAYTCDKTAAATGSQEHPFEALDQDLVLSLLFVHV